MANPERYCYEGILQSTSEDVVDLLRGWEHIDHLVPNEAPDVGIALYLVLSEEYELLADAGHLEPQHFPLFFLYGVELLLYYGLRPDAFADMLIVEFQVEEFLDLIQIDILAQLLRTCPHIRAHLAPLDALNEFTLFK